MADEVEVKVGNITLKFNSEGLDLVNTTMAITASLLILATILYILFSKKGG